MTKETLISVVKMEIAHQKSMIAYYEEKIAIANTEDNNDDYFWYTAKKHVTEDEIQFLQSLIK